nr:MAG TPA: hypothetical protein [Caudoviricetes sp.]
MAHAVGGYVQRWLPVAHVQHPHQQGGDNEVLHASVCLQHAVQVVHVLGQQLALGFHLFLGGLNVFEQAHVRMQLGQYQLMLAALGGAAKWIGSCCALGFLPGKDAGEMALNWGKWHGVGAVWVRKKEPLRDGSVSGSRSCDWRQLLAALGRCFSFGLVFGDAFHQSDFAEVLDHPRVVGGLIGLHTVTLGHVFDVAAAATVLVVDGEVVQRGDEHRPSREVRCHHGRQSAQAALAHHNVCSQLFGGGFLTVHQREQLVVHQVAADEDDQVRVITVHGVQQLDGVKDQTIQRLVVRICVAVSCTIQNALFCVFTDVLQPALGHVLQQGIGGDVGIRCSMGAVEADHDAVQRAALHDGTADAGLEVLELGPCIQLGIANVRVVVDLHALVAFLAQRGGVYGLAGAVAAGVGAAGNGAGDAQANFFALELVHANDVDLGEERAGLLQLGLQLLLDRGLHVELRGGVIHAIELGLGAQVAVEQLAGFVAHKRKSLLGC